MCKRLDRAEQRRVEIERARALVTNLRALLAGEMTRAQMLTRLGEARALKGPFFRRQPALCVYDSLLSLDERRGEELLVREVDLRGYLRWLTEGECFHGDGDALFVLERDIDDFAAETGTEAIRWWFDGLGWWVSLQFGSPASGRAFVVHADLERPTTLGLHAQRGADYNDAVIDLFEVLAIDDGDVSHMHPKVELDRLPVWALLHLCDDGEPVELARFRSYAKACAQEQALTALGGQEIYRVEPA